LCETLSGSEPAGNRNKWRENGGKIGVFVSLSSLGKLTFVQVRG